MAWLREMGVGSQTTPRGGAFGRVCHDSDLPRHLLTGRFEGKAHDSQRLRDNLD